MTTRRRKRRWDTDFAVATGLAGFDAFLAFRDPELLELNRLWVVEVRIARELLQEQVAA